MILPAVRLGPLLVLATGDELSNVQASSGPLARLFIQHLFLLDGDIP